MLQIDIKEGIESILELFREIQRLLREISDRLGFGIDSLTTALISVGILVVIGLVIAKVWNRMHKTSS